MSISRRDALRGTLFGAGAIGLRSLATGLPASLLLSPSRALAGVDGGPANSDAGAPPLSPQFIILSTSVWGDPIGCNMPGTYDDPALAHSQDPKMAKTALTLHGSATSAAAPWAKLPQNVLDRSAFFHLMTNTSIHPHEPDTLALGGALAAREMFPSALAKLLGPALGTVQAQPIVLGAATPNEMVTFAGAPLPFIPPLALRATLTSPTGPLSNLQSTRDKALAVVFNVYKTSATKAEKAFIDSLVTSETQLRSIQHSLMTSLSQIKDNGPASQVQAAITLIKMKVTPVVTIHIPFGGDNHSDAALNDETQQTVDGVGTIAALMSGLAAAGLSDSVTFLSLNVFGRTMSRKTSSDGRDHNASHQGSIAIGKPFRGGVYGGIGVVGNDYGALPIVSSTGRGDLSGDVSVAGTMTAFGATVMTAVGADASAVAATIPSGKVIKAAIA